MLIGLKSFSNSKVLLLTFKTCVLFNCLFFYIDIPNDPCLHIVKKYSFLFLNCYVFQKSIKNINFNVTQAILCDHK